MSSFPMWRRAKCPNLRLADGQLWSHYDWKTSSSVGKVIFRLRFFEKLKFSESCLASGVHQPSEPGPINHTEPGPGFLEEVSFLYKSLFLMPFDSGEIGSWESTPGFDSLPSHREGPWVWLCFWPTPKCQRFTANIVSAEVRIIVWMKDR